MNTICKYYRQGRCHFGNKCWNLHLKPAQNVVKQMLSSTLTGITDCDLIILMYSHTDDMKSVGCVDRYSRQLLNVCNTSLFWQRKVEKLYQLYTTKSNLDFKSISLRLEQGEFEKQCYFDKYKRQSIRLCTELMALLYENGIDLDNPYKMVVKNDTVKSVNVTENEIVILFHKTTKLLKLFAEADCCSHNWFEKLNQSFDYLVGKEIISIDDIETFEMDDDDAEGHECMLNHRIVICLANAKPFEFVLRNSSNGYYDGGLSITII